MAEEMVSSKIDTGKYTFHENPTTTILAIGARIKDVARADLLATELQSVLPFYSGSKVEGSYWTGEYSDKTTGQSMGESWTLSFNRQDGNFDQVVVTKNNTSGATGVIVSLDVDESGLSKFEADFRFDDFILTNLAQIQLYQLPDSPLTPLIRKLAGISEKIDGGMDKNLAPSTSNGGK